RTKSSSRRRRCPGSDGSSKGRRVLRLLFGSPLSPCSPSAAGSSMSVRNLEELIDENHAIISLSIGLEYYVRILSFVDKDQLELGCAILMHNKVSFAGLMIMVWSYDLGLVKIFGVLGENWLWFS
ncbi:26S protease regulatory subunit 4, partial [Musa troglodytarum]